jgi:hypothetical protein
VVVTAGRPGCARAQASPNGSTASPDPRCQRQRLHPHSSLTPTPPPLSQLPGFRLGRCRRHGIRRVCRVRRMLSTAACSDRLSSVRPLPAASSSSSPPAGRRGTPTSRGVAEFGEGAHGRGETGPGRVVVLWGSGMTSVGGGVVRRQTTGWRPVPPRCQDAETVCHFLMAPVSTGAAPRSALGERMRASTCGLRRAVLAWNAAPNRTPSLRSRPMAVLCKRALAVPDHIVTLEESLELARRMHHDYPPRDLALGLIENTGVLKRHVVQPLERGATPPRSRGPQCRLPSGAPPPGLARGGGTRL